MRSASAPVTRTGTANEVGHKSQIDPEALGIVMDILSKMYTNGPRAVLREYSCNGVDSHVEAGQVRPIEVDLPTELQPSLTIRDFGTGLTEEQIISVFGTYGRSTKRDTNGQVGKFGIGSKSAFVLTNSFIVTGFKDGVRTVVEFGLDKDGVSTAYVKRITETDEPNGVLISMGVPDISRMVSEARIFFSTWEKGNVLVNGEEPEYVWDSAKALSSDIWVKDGGEGNINVVMGQVAYPADRSLLRTVAKHLEGTESYPMAQSLAEWYESTDLFFKVPIGSVEIAPNREGLRDTDETVKVVADMISELVANVSRTVRQAVDSAPSKHAAAVALTREIEGLGAFRVKRSSFPYKGEELTKETSVKDIPVLFMTKKNWRGSAMIVGEQEGHVVDSNSAHRVLVVPVSECDRAKVKRYAKRFLESATNEYTHILVPEESTGESGWFQWGVTGGADTWTLDEYRAALRALRSSDPRTKSEPSYSVGWHTTASRDLDDRDLLTDIIEWGKPIAVFHEYVRKGAFAAKVLDDLYTPVVLLATQSEKALVQRVEADGRVEIVDDHTVLDGLVRKAARKHAGRISAKELSALGARQWLQRNQYAISNFESTVLALTAQGEIKHQGLLDDIDTVELARLIAADITEDKVRRLEEVSAWLTTTEVAYEAEIVGLSGKRFPLLADLSEFKIRRNEVIAKEVLDYINSKA